MISNANSEISAIRSGNFKMKRFTLNPFDYATELKRAYKTFALEH